jgi:hypothetical protein
MKKIYLLLFFASFFVGNAQVNWRRGSATTLYPTANAPTWMGLTTPKDTERGMAVLGDKMYVVSRKVGNLIKVINTADGTDLPDVTTYTGVSGGNFLLSDVEVSTNGAILACNMTTATNTSAFKIYKWDSETATPSTYISFTNAGATTSNLRLGDMFSVTGDIEGDAVIMAAGQSLSSGANSVHKIVRWQVTGGVLNTTPTIITLSLGNASTYISAVPVDLTDTSDIYVKLAGRGLVKCNAAGTIIESTTVLGSSASDIKYIAAGTKKYIAAYVPGIATEQTRLLDVTNGLSAAFTVTSTPQLGAVSNGNSAGGVGVKTTLDPVDGLNTITIYTLGCNNGISGTTLVNNGTTVVLSNNDFTAIDKQNAVKIFPNPTSNEFQIAIDTNLEKEAQASIYDVQGRQVKSAKIAAKNQTVSIEDLTAGYYLVKIINGNNTSSTKLLKK